MPGRGISWTAETHETLLVAIITSGAPIIPNAVLAAWPAHKGPPPTLSALQQHLAGLKKKVGATTSVSAAPTPASTKAKKSATGTFGSGTSSRGRPSAGKNTLFSGAASKSTRARYHADTDDSEPERGDTCASTDDNASPTPNAGLGKKGSSGSALGKRRRRPAHEEEGLDDSPIDYKGHLFMDQLKAAAGGVKEEPEYEGYGGGFKKVKVEKGSRTKSFAHLDEGF